MDETGNAARAALFLVQGLLGQLVVDGVVDGPRFLDVVRRMEDRQVTAENVAAFRLARITAEAVIEGRPAT